MSEGEKRQFKPDLLSADDPYAHIKDQEVVDVLGVAWVFQHMLSPDLKRLERSARNPRTGTIDGARLSRAFYEAVVLGRADDKGSVIPGSRIPYDNLKDQVGNAFDAALTSFLGYSG